MEDKKEKTDDATIIDATRIIDTLRLVVDGVPNFTEEDIGETVTIITAEGTYITQEVVKTYCQFCGEEMIGTIRAAGGFLAAHDVYHKAEAPLAQMEGMR